MASGVEGTTVVFASGVIAPDTGDWGRQEAEQEQQQQQEEAGGSGGCRDVRGGKGRVEVEKGRGKRRSYARAGWDGTGRDIFWGTGCVRRSQALAMPWDVRGCTVLRYAATCARRCRRQRGWGQRQWRRRQRQRRRVGGGAAALVHHARARVLRGGGGGAGLLQRAHGRRMVPPAEVGDGSGWADTWTGGWRTGSWAGCGSGLHE